MKFLMFFFVSVTRSINSVSLSTSVAQLNFTEHCASIASQYSNPLKDARNSSSVHRLTGFYYTTDALNIFSQNLTYDVVQNSVVLSFQYDGAAHEQGLFRVHGSLLFPKEGTHTYILRNYTHILSSDFRLDGVWSESSGELCMVGSASIYSKKSGNLLEPAAVLKLYNVKSSSNVTSLITGKLKSLISSKNDPSFFAPISMAMLSFISYKYPFASNRSYNSYFEGNDIPSSSLNIGIRSFCRVFSSSVLTRQFPLRYSSRCISGKNCSPLTIFHSPRTVSLKSFECLKDKQRLRVLVDFADNRDRQQPLAFSPRTTLVGEGSWDAEKNQLCVVACRFINVTGNFNNTHIGDCTTILSLRFPAIWTMGRSSSIVGQIWSTKTATEWGYFENITFGNDHSDAADRFVLQGQKYEYTEVDKVTKSCPRKKSTAKKKNNIYPSPFSYDMRFDMWAKKSTAKIGWGFALPLSIDNQFYHMYMYSMEDGTEEHSVASVSAPVSYIYNHKNRYNISYRMGLRIKDVRMPSGVYIMIISAEGIYDDTEGSLCMVGCRNLVSNSHQLPTFDSIDCEIVVNVQFPPENRKSTDSGNIKGSIESTREMSDPLHFERLDLNSVAADILEAERSIRRMNVEIILVLVSKTAAYVFVALQLFHVKRHPDVLPSISILLLFILALGYMIPLVLHFDAMFTQHSSKTVFLGRGWLELSEVIVKVVTLVGFLLQIRLLQLTMSAKSPRGNRKELWNVEKLALFVALPVYVAGSLVALILMNWRDIIAVIIPRNQWYPILDTTLKSCAGLVMDMFLLPQILLNIFSKSTEKALSVWYHIITVLG